MGITEKNYRIADASLNRIGEGLRFLEEIARFTLNDSRASAALKNTRHKIVIHDAAFNRRLLAARDAAGDVGADTIVPGEPRSKDLPALISANARRAAESLRVMEELAKLPEFTGELETETFRQARFEIYEIEQNLQARLLRQDKLGKLPGLYGIIDIEVLDGRNPLEAAAAIIRGGASAIQLRDNISPKKLKLPVATALRSLCAEHSILFIINNELDIALACDADGLHIGQDDLDATIARQLLPVDRILGVSVSTAEEAAAAESAGADYLGVGAIYATGTKSDVNVIGAAGLKDIRWCSGLPLVAIGGIDASNVAEVVAAGAESAAVISAILNADDVTTAARRIADTIGAGLE